MDDRSRQQRLSFKISIQSRKSNLSSCRSLERPSWSDRLPSLNKNHTFIEVMSLQHSRKSDIYQKMLEQAKPLQKQSLGGIGIASNSFDFLGFQENPNMNIGLTLRKSEQKGQTVNHTCKCYTTCQWDTCECLEANNQLCVQGYCCQGCIERKTALLSGLKERIEEQSSIFCTCKKTKCKKKYCTCFAAGIMCGDKCSCQGCVNCPKMSEGGMEVEEEQDQLTQQQLARMELPEKMQFQPFQYGRISN